jgi:hypothetical protein
MEGSPQTIRVGREVLGRGFAPGEPSTALPTAQAISVLAKTTKDTNAILHLTC